jgi:hypothetical protein
VQQLLTVPHASVYDSWFTPENQLRLLNLEYFHDELVAQLRMDVLLFRKIALTDIAVLDGWFFGQTDPNDLLEQCGRGRLNRALPMTLYCRKPTFEESLATFLFRPDRLTLNDYPLQLLRDPEARNAIRHGLGRTPASRLEDLLTLENSVPNAVGKLLDEVLQSEGIVEHTVDQFVPYWEKWIKAEQSGLVRVQEWSQRMSVRGSIRSDPLSATDDLLTDDGRTAYREVRDLLRNGRLNKSDALSVVPAPDHRDAEYAWDYATILEWFDRQRSRAVAAQHGAIFAYDQLALYPTSHAPGHFTGLAGSIDLSNVASHFLIEVPKEYRSLVSSLPGSDFGALFSGHHAAFEEAWTKPDRNNIKRVIDLVFSQTTTSDSPPRLTMERAVRVFGQVLAGGVADRVAGPFAAIGIILASEGIFMAADRLKSHEAIRQVVDYSTSRLQPSSIADSQHID